MLERQVSALLQVDPTGVPPWLVFVLSGVLLLLASLRAGQLLLRRQAIRAVERQPSSAARKDMLELQRILHAPKPRRPWQRPRNGRRHDGAEGLEAGDDSGA